MQAGKQQGEAGQAARPAGTQQGRQASSKAGKQAARLAGKQQGNRQGHGTKRSSKGGKQHYVCDQGRI
jgi:hypothetical protein